MQTPRFALDTFATARASEANDLGYMFGSMIPTPAPAAPANAELPPPQAPTAPVPEMPAATPAPAAPAPAPAPAVAAPVQQPQPQAQAQAQPQGEYSTLFGNLEQQYGLPAGYLSFTYGKESSYGKNMSNPNSSSKGPFGFLDSTARQYGIAPDQRMSVEGSAPAAAKLAADNRRILASKLGREPTASELYLAHQQGPVAAAAMLANPDANAVDVLTGVLGSRERAEKHITLNGGSVTMSSRDFVAGHSKAPGGAPSASAANGYSGASTSPTQTYGTPFVPSMPEEELQLGMLDTIKAVFRGENPDTFDPRSGLLALSTGLSQMSHGLPVDASKVLDQQARRNELRREEYRKQRARVSAAKYAAENGDYTSAQAIMDGGMDLGDFLNVRQQRAAEERAAIEDRQTEIGRQTIYNAVISQGGSAADAELASRSPETYFSMHKQKQLDDEIQSKLAEDQATRGWLVDTYGAMTDNPDAQNIANAARSGVPLDVIKQTWDLNLSNMNATSALADTLKDAGQPAGVVAAVQGGAPINDALAVGKVATDAQEQRNDAAGRQATIQSLRSGPLAASVPNATAVADIMQTSDMSLDDASSVAKQNDWQVYAADRASRNLPTSYDEYTRLNNPGRFNDSGLKAENEAVGKASADWYTSGATDYAASSSTLDAAIDLLDHGNVQSNAITGAIVNSDKYAALAPFILNNDTINAQDMVRQIAQKMVKSLIGGDSQFTEAEARMAIDRLYNPQLSAEENSKRSKRFKVMLDSEAQNKDEFFSAFSDAGGRVSDIPKDKRPSGAKSLARISALLDEMDAEAKQKYPQAFGFTDTSNMSQSELIAKAKELGVNIDDLIKE